jgi:hypothetical protein
VRRILDEASVLGIDDDSYIEYENIEDFKQWILSLKPKDVRDEGISKQTLWNIKKRIRKNEMQIQSLEGNLQGLSRKEIK